MGNSVLSSVQFCSPNVAKRWVNLKGGPAPGVYNDDIFKNVTKRAENSGKVIQRVCVLVWDQLDHLFWLSC
jgi:hypothetical protein